MQSGRTPERDESEQVEDNPRGALALALLFAAVLVAVWLAVYFGVYVPRG